MDGSYGSVDSYGALAMLTFLFVICKIKYESIDYLRESVMEYLSQKLSKEIIEEPDDIISLEEITDMLVDFIVENKELFCKYKVKE